MFENGLEEFDDARYVLLKSFYSSITSPIRATCEELLREYKACESPEYITYVRYTDPPLLICNTNIIGTEC